MREIRMIIITHNLQYPNRLLKVFKRMGSLPSSVVILSDELQRNGVFLILPIRVQLLEYEQSLY